MDPGDPGESIRQRLERLFTPQRWRRNGVVAAAARASRSSRCGAALVAALLAAQPAGAQFGARAATAGPPLAKSAAEAQALAVLDDIDRHQRYLNVPREDGRLLRLLAESIGAQQVVEVGTSTGYSGIWLALALRAEERRALFEEAAGIGLYQSKKQNALEKLEETQHNLLRVNDIVN